MSVTLQQLEFFRAVARALSFSQAAKVLYTSQPYVSNQIRKLEDHFGVPLFVRSYPRVGLTEAGTVLYERIGPILDDIGELEHVVQQFQGLHRGSVTLAAAASSGNHLVPDMIGQFHREFPDIIVRVRVGNTEEVLEWLDLDEAEIGISPRRPQARALVTEPFYRDTLVVICPAAMELPETLSLAELAALPKVVREDGSLTQTKMHKLLEGYPSGADFVAQFSGTTAVNEAVAAGIGVSLVPSRSARAWVDAGAVRTVPLRDAKPFHTNYLVYGQQRYITPAARALIEHLRRNARA